MGHLGMETQLLDHSDYGAVSPLIGRIKLPTAPQIYCGASSVPLLDPASSQSVPGFTKAFGDFCSSHEPRHWVYLAAVSPDHVKYISAGAALLASVLPELGPDTMRFARAIALVDSGCTILSTTLNGLPGLIFIDCHVSATAVMAELLFHEGLHAKLDGCGSSEVIVSAGI